MKFGPTRTTRAEGAILAHAVGQGGQRFRKGHLLTGGDVAALAASGVETVIVALLDDGDIGEDDAAAKIAAGLVIHGADRRTATTGRVNIHAQAAGLFTVARELIDALNSVHPDITIATLANRSAVKAGQMVATVKIIPFAVANAVVDRVLDTVGSQEAFRVSPFASLRVALIQTELPGVKVSVLDKTREITATRLARSGSIIALERRVPHRAGPLAQAIDEVARQTDMVLVFGASAVSDTQDVIPSAIRTARGVVKRVGMPVDPGNLLVLGELDGKPVIGAPGCARSPKENGFDWILDRLLAGQDVDNEDIAGMGVGGLLTEIGTRPAPRERLARRAAGSGTRPVEVHAVILAAGRSSRMGGSNKLLARFDGVPLIRRTAERVLSSRAATTLVVTGHQAAGIGAALVDLPVMAVHNAAFADGLSSSLKVGIAALPPSAAGALVMLGDMPQVSTGDIDRMITAFVAAGGGAIVRATHDGKRGNPVILPRDSFPMLQDIEGDTGARAIVESGAIETIDVELGTAASLDVDTPEAMHRAGGILVP